MSPGGMMSMAWMPLCGQSWIGAAVSFIGMWSVMMMTMMLPSLAPRLWHYRCDPGRAGELAALLSPAFAAAGYLLVWVLIGAAVYPLGAATMLITMHYPVLARAVPVATGLVLLAAGALQFTGWKAHHLACCRNDDCRAPPGHGRASPTPAATAWRQGLRLGIHCSQCSAGLTAALIVIGIMDWPVMIAVTAAINLERLAPAGERVARLTGVIVVGAGLLVISRAAGL